ncbi:MAG: hypothetical protein AAB726_01930 [Patescibacteria group bacterium]
MKISPTLNKSASVLQTLKVIVLALVLTVGFQYIVAQAVGWQSPTTGAPGGNTPAPLNVGITGQIKDGGLTVGAGLDPNSATAVGLNVPSGRVVMKVAPGGPAAGQVLKAQDTNGTLMWGNDNTGAGGGGVITFYNGNTHIGNYGIFNVRSDGPFGLQNSTIFASAAELYLKPSYVIPQGCSTNQIPKWNGSAWTCQADNAGAAAPAGPTQFKYFCIANNPSSHDVCPAGWTSMGVIDNGGVAWCADPVTGTFRNWSSDMVSCFR